MNKIQKTVFLLIGTVIFSCTDPNIIGLEVQPPSDKIIIKNDLIESFTIKTISEEELRTDEADRLLLGKMDGGSVFGVNVASFVTQMLLPSNNIETIENVVVDSVILSYFYTDFYGDLDENTYFEVQVYENAEAIFKDSMYYSNYSPISSEFDLALSTEFIEEFSEEDSTQGVLNIKIDTDLGQKLIDASGTEHMVDNVAFLEFFKGLYVRASTTNTIVYLNPKQSKSRFSVYYHEIGIDTAVSFDFDLESEAARINIFNQKDLSDLDTNEGESYIQSMAGYKAEITINNLQSIKDTLEGKAINKVTIDFKIIEDEGYPAHNELHLLKEKNDGEIKFLIDYILQADSEGVPGEKLQGNLYSFNISRYFYQLLNNSDYTNKLYLLSDGGAVNANRTKLDNSKISISIIYSEL